MPIYEYRCQACGEEFEKLVRSSAEADQVECPRCHQVRVKRRLSLFGLGGSARSGEASLASATDSSCATST
ncbi:MAG: zinc ribbon domain-containing protein [Chloroflexi bacterium]|nr:zinc ribbon domain-containing protein [Chloroflexota bacterium]